MKDYYNDNYPSEPIGGCNPYHCCSLCKVSAPEINGTLEGHAVDCPWRLEQEKKEKRDKTPIMEYFDYAHLPDHIKKVSKSFCELAMEMNTELPDSAEKSAGLRKLLEAKDCFVRAAL